MPNVKQSFVYEMFMQEGRSLAELLSAASRTGFRAVEAWYLGQDREDFVAAARLTKLRVASFIGHHELKNGMNNPDNHDRIEAELRENIAFAGKHNIPGLICLSGNLAAGADVVAATNAIVAILSKVKGAAEAAGVNLNMEVLNTRVDHAGYQVNSTLAGVEIIKRVASPNVKILYDIYHMQIMEGDLIRTIRDNIQYIGHFHTAGAPGRHDIDDQQEINYPAVMKAIAAAGYNMYVGHEFVPLSADKTESLAKAFRVCDVQ